MANSSRFAKKWSASKGGWHRRRITFTDILLVAISDRAESLCITA
jgi:hypothetical protein